MTKEEAINDIIDMVKNGVSNPLDVYCDSYPCSTCPFHNDENGECAETIISGLIDRLLKAEEHQETNLEHYRDSVIITDAYVAFKNSDYNTVTDWLLAPYEEPKPTYRLSQFEHDLLNYFGDSKYGIRDFWILEHMQNKGHFKGIPTDVPIRDIIDNCEVVEE